MSQSDRILSKLENHCSIIEYLKENYPSILSQWKNKCAGLVAQTQQTTDAATLVINQNDYTERINS